MEVSLKENIKCQMFIHLPTKIKVKSNFNQYYKMITLILVTKMSQILGYSYKIPNNKIINMIFKARVNKDKNHFMGIQINSNITTNIIIKEIMGVHWKIHFKEI